MADITLEMTDLNKLKEYFEATNIQYSNAIFYAIKDTNRWLKAQVIREVRKKYPIELRRIKKRMFGTAKVFHGEAVSWIWLGVSGIDANAFGRAVQTKKGVYLPNIKKMIPSAFISKKLHNLIFMREGRSRLPIIKPLVELEFDNLLDKYTPLAEKKFHQLLQDKLRSFTRV